MKTQAQWRTGKLAVGDHTVSLEFAVGQWLIKLEAWDLHDWQSMELCKGIETKRTYNTAVVVQMHNKKGEGVNAIDLKDPKKLGIIFELAKIESKGKVQLMQAMLEGAGFYKGDHA